jgi:hypothetical protein
MRHHEHSTQGKYKRHHILMVLVFVFLGIHGKASINGGDTSRTSYPINDPRNPNCPCHLYQKIADDEYRQLLNRTDQSNSTSILAETNHHEMGSETKSNAKRSSRYGSQFKIKFTSFHNKKVNTKRKAKKHRKLIKRNNTIDRCFNFSILVSTLSS